MATVANGLSAAPMKVFLLAGQSNMVGSGHVNNIPIADAHLRDPQNDVLLFFGDPHAAHPPGSTVPGKTLIPLQPGATSGTGTSSFGPELSFGRAMADAMLGEAIALIKHAHAGSKLATDWNPVTGYVYSAFKQTVAEGLAALRAEGHSPEIVGMMWMQGESDVWDDNRRDAYEADLTNFISEIRTKYGSALPFVIGQLSIHQTAHRERSEPDRVLHLEAIRLAQANVAHDLPGVGIVDTNDFSLLSDDLHFDAEGLIALGTGMANEYLSIVPEPSTALLSIMGFVLMFVRRKQWRERVKPASR